MKEAKNKITQIYNRYRSGNGTKGGPLGKKMTKEEKAEGIINDITIDINAVVEESLRRLNEEETEELNVYAASSINRFSTIAKKGI